jgi:transcription initiation factor TFIID subunit TAF12
MADEFIESILEMSCQLGKHKKAENLSVNDIIYSMGKLIFNLREKLRYYRTK